MIGILLAMIQGVLAGQGVGAILGTVTLPQWIGVAADAIEAAPDVRRALKALHPAFSHLIQDIEHNIGAKEAGTRAYRAFGAISKHEAEVELGINDPDSPWFGKHLP